MSEYGRLCHGDGGHEGGGRCRRAFMLTIPGLKARFESRLLPLFKRRTEDVGRLLRLERSRPFLADLASLAMPSVRSSVRALKVTGARHTPRDEAPERSTIRASPPLPCHAGWQARRRGGFGCG